MAHQKDRLPWEAFASVFELNHTNTCQHDAYNLHVLARPESGTKFGNFLDALVRSVTEDAARQRKQYPSEILCSWWG